MLDIQNAVDPAPEQIEAFLAAPGADRPVYMLNLLKFKETAAYKDGEDISGRAAYGRYAKAFTKLVQSQNIAGFEVTFSGNVGAVLIGAGDGIDAGAWDAVAIVRYPNAQTMIDMVSSPEYRKIHRHRRAGLEGQLLISCSSAGDLFS